MGNEYELYHGATGNAILGIIRDRAMRPDSNHKVFLTQRLDDTWQHGGDSKRKATFAFKAKITVPPSASVERTSLHGNPLAVVVTTNLPIPTQILELYVRLPRAAQYQTVRGVEAIKAYLA